MKRSLKAICSALFALVASVVLASCSLFAGEEGDVRDMVDSTLKIFKFAENSDAASFADQSTLDTLSAYGVDANEFMGHCFKNLEWEFGEIKLSGDTGTVVVTITNVNIAVALEKAGEQFSAYAETDEARELFNTEGEQALIKKLFSFFYEVIDSGELDTTTTEVTLQVYKNDEGAWEIKTDNDAFYQALYGGANFKI